MKLAVICARGGSKGVPGKNERPFRGRPLLVHAIETAAESHAFDAIVVSSDSDRLLGLAEAAGVTLAIRRPASLASDVASKLDAIVHAVETTEAHLGARADLVVDLDVTTPLRSPGDITDAIDLLDPPLVNRVFTASLARRSPYFNQVELDGGGVPHLPCGEGLITRRQDSPTVYDLSGAVYVWSRDALDNPHPLIQNDTRLLILPAERAWDIDQELDLVIVESLAAHQFGSGD